MSVAVGPVRSAVLAQAEADVERILETADDRAASVLAEAEAEGTALVEDARSEGASVASVAEAHVEARARRRARTLVLGAQRDLYRELRREALEAARALRQDPLYPDLLDRLSAEARAQLGDDTALEVDPPDVGGVRASSGRRHVDYTLDALAERCLARLGSRVERLWR